MGKYIQCEKYSALGDYEKKLEDIAREEREKGNKLILTSGAFDFLFPPHISYLRKIKEEYKKENGILFVNVDNDARVKLHKGPNKPINKAYYRAFIVSNLKGVDYVSVNPEEKFSPTFKFASIIKPDYIVQTKPWTEELKKELKTIFLENSLPELVEFERISDLAFSKISMGQFVQFEQYENMARYREKLEDIVKEEREKGNQIVLTSGTFDVLISGHIHYLNELKKKYSKSSLFVNIENDERVKIRKGKHKPINTSYKRAFIISNLEAVNYATVHPEEKSRPTYQVARIIKPDYLVQPFAFTKEKREKLKEVLGKDYINTKQIHFSRKQQGIHTTDLVKKAIKFYSNEEESDFSKFNLIYLAELSKKLNESRNFDEFYARNPEAVPFIQTIKKLTEKPEKYIEIRASIMSNVLKLKKAWNLSSYSELNDFLSKLAEFDSSNLLDNKPDEVAVDSASENLIQKSEGLPNDADLAGGGD